MKSITEQKPLEEILENMGKYKKVYLIGCGTCATLCHTGGREEVIKMEEELKEKGKEVRGWMIVPTCCDVLTEEALRQEEEKVKNSDCILVLACAFGVQRVAGSTPLPVFPALNTLFLGKEEGGGIYAEICKQCGECIIGLTGGICPVTTCSKGLLHGPCGGMDKGKCEVDKEKDCAWALIYEKLKSQGRLKLMCGPMKPKDWGVVKRPGKVKLEW